MKLTPKQRNVAIFVGIGVITIAYLVWKRKNNEKEAGAILEYINNMPSQVDASDGAQQGMDIVRGTKIDFNKMKVDNLSGSYKNPAIRNAIANIVTELYASIKGGGTDIKNFTKQFDRVKNKNTMAFIDKVYKAQFKEGLFEAMKGEVALSSPYYAMFNDKTKYDMIIPFFSETKWNPKLSAYFENLPTY